MELIVNPLIGGYRKVCFLNAGKHNEDYEITFSRDEWLQLADVIKATPDLVPPVELEVEINDTSANVSWTLAQKPEKFQFWMRSSNDISGDDVVI